MSHRKANAARTTATDGQDAPAAQRVKLHLQCNDHWGRADTLIALEVLNIAGQVVIELEGDEAAGERISFEQAPRYWRLHLFASGVDMFDDPATAEVHCRMADYVPRYGNNNSWALVEVDLADASRIVTALLQFKHWVVVQAPAHDADSVSRLRSISPDELWRVVE